MLLVRERPEYPPSFVALKKQEETQFFKMLGMALGNKSFVLILIIFAALDGVFGGIGVVLNPFLTSLNFTSTDVSLLGGIFVASGVLSSIVVGKLLDKT